jgi:uncharacterized protein (TIGR03118 family)
MAMRINKRGLSFFTALFIAVGSQSASAQFSETNLFSNIPGQAKATDPQLVDPWGMSFSPTSPVWVANEGTGVATLYNTTTGKQGLVVTVPGNGGGQGTPTGTVNNLNIAAFNGDNFLFATRDGLIAGWRGALGTTAEILANNSSSAATYTGLAIATPSAGNTYLYGANFQSGAIDVFKGNNLTPGLSGNFTDPNLPVGYAPFNIQTLNGQLYVTYAPQDAAKFSPVAGVGHGIVDIFSTDGTLVSRLATGGSLNVPWGLAIAPNGFGSFGGDLLVGNNGDGTIDIFDPITGLLIGMLKDGLGNPLTIDGLMGLAFGNGASFSSQALLFTGGDGVFGEIQATPIPAALPLFASSLGALGLLGWRRKKKAQAAAAD